MQAREAPGLLAANDVQADVLVALEPLAQRLADMRRGMGKISGHEEVQRVQRFLDRFPLDEVMRAQVRKRVFQLDLSRQHAIREWLTACGVDGILEAIAQYSAHGTSRTRSTPRASRSPHPSVVRRCRSARPHYA